MSAPSKWPLPEAGIRFLTPSFMVEKLARHPLTKECYPTAMGFYPNALGHRMQRPRHDDNLLIYCTEGQGYLSAPQWQGEIGEGQVLLLPQGLEHSYEAASESPWTIYWVHFQGAATGIFLQYLGFREHRPVVSAGVSPVLIAAFTSLGRSSTPRTACDTCSVTWHSKSTCSRAGSEAAWSCPGCRAICTSTSTRT